MLTKIRCRCYATDSWFKPRSTQILFQPNPEKLRRRLEQAAEQERLHPPTIMPRHEQIVSGTRINQLNIQMLPTSLYQHVFKNYPVNHVPDELIQSCKRDLHKHGMVTKEDAYLPDVQLDLPPLKGQNLEEHFQTIAEDQSKPYLLLAQRLLLQIPTKPRVWLFQSGWTRYSRAGPERVDFPLEADLVFDVEVCVRSGKQPQLATAVSSAAWYSWVSDALVDFDVSTNSHKYQENDLIRFESVPGPADDDLKYVDHRKLPKLVVGHNVSFDRARIREQYALKRTGTRFIDTMSLHICISGMTSYQRAMIKAKNAEIGPADAEWKRLSSLNNLSDVHRLYCGTEVSKDPRSVFVEGTLKDIREDFQTLMHYCANDVIATHAVFQKTFPLFQLRFPHPVTLAGMLELSTAYLPVNRNWDRYLEECELTYEEMEGEAKMLLAKRADQACHLLHGEQYKQDLWMWDQDWATKDLKISKKKAEKKKTENQVAINEEEVEEDPLDHKFAYLYEMQPRTTLLPGYPNWYRKLAVKAHAAEGWTPGPHLISTSMQITPKLLNLTWEGYPLHFIRGQGWGFLVPFATHCENEAFPLKQLLAHCPVLDSKIQRDYVPANIRQDVEDNLVRREFYRKVKKNCPEDGAAYQGTGIWCNTLLHDCVYFYKLPHKDGASSRVGNPLAKDFLNKFSENVLAGDSAIAERVLEIARMLSYWRNNRERIKDQMVVWLGRNVGVILPQLVVCGTLTRRAVEATWMTASSPRTDRIGSELRGLVQAPEGFRFVGADVDSQELWIASVIGDAQHAGVHGATPLGWMTLSGSKTDGTDMHSLTAKSVGISRDHAKVINYARIYGAGQNFAEQLLKQFNPAISNQEARSKANKMFELTKGKRVFRLRPEYLHELADEAYPKWQAHHLAKMHGKTLGEMFHQPRWVAGTESAMFNSLEEIANQNSPVTPFLGSRLSRVLEPSHNADDKFLPTRVNWVVQSGAVDYLHLMLVCMNWLMGDKARFSLSFHDEVRYLVAEKHQYDAALALHVTNLLTRAFCSIKLGIYDLPYSVAFFSSVEIDTALRKESKQDCKTPSNPYGLEKAYGIANGESLNIYETIRRVKETK